MQCRFLVIFILLSSSIFGQVKEKPDKYWGISLAYTQSSARLPNGYGIVYPGAPLWAGDLKVDEIAKNGFAIEIVRELPFKRRNFLLESSLGFSSLGFITHYDYDYENSINNIVRKDRSFSYFNLLQKVKYSFTINQKISVIPSAGIFVGYLVKSKEKNTNYQRGGSFRTTEANYLGYENRWNYGYQVGLSARFRTPKITFDVNTFFRDYHKSHYGDMTKRVSMLGIGLIFYQPEKSMSENKYR